MTKQDIRLHLIDRYVNGYNLLDEKYEEIKNTILNEIGKECTLDNLHSIFKKYLDKYNDYTGGLYYEILCIYIKNILHKKPDPDLISYLLP